MKTLARVLVAILLGGKGWGKRERLRAQRLKI